MIVSNGIGSRGSWKSWVTSSPDSMTPARSERYPIRSATRRCCF
jgi:hypothetical protein